MSRRDSEEEFMFLILRVLNRSSLTLSAICDQCYDWFLIIRVQKKLTTLALTKGIRGQRLCLLTNQRLGSVRGQGSSTQSMSNVSSQPTDSLCLMQNILHLVYTRHETRAKCLDWEKAKSLLKAKVNGTTELRCRSILQKCVLQCNVYLYCKTSLLLKCVLQLFLKLRFLAKFLIIGIAYLLYEINPTVLLPSFKGQGKQRYCKARKTFIAPFCAGLVDWLFCFTSTSFLKSQSSMPRHSNLQYTKRCHPFF